MKIKEYFYPTLNFKPYGKEFNNYPVTDYAEIELIPEENDEILLENLDRYASRLDFNEKELKELDNPNSDLYEHIVCYVHFKKGTYKLNRIGIEVITAYQADEIDIYDKLDKEIKTKIINEAKYSLKKWRKTKNIIDEGY